MPGAAPAPLSSLTAALPPSPPRPRDPPARATPTRKGFAEAPEAAPPRRQPLTSGVLRHGLPDLLPGGRFECGTEAPALGRGTELSVAPRHRPVTGDRLEGGTEAPPYDGG